MSRALRLSILCHGMTSHPNAPGFPADDGLLPGEADRIRAAGSQDADNLTLLSGPERRCRETAEALGRAYEIDTDLRDIDYGRWAGRRLADIGAAEPDALAAWAGNPDGAPHGGEPIAKLIARVAGWMTQKRDRKGDMLVITHPAVVRAMVLTVLDAPASSFWKLDVQHLSRADFTSDGRRWALRALVPPAR